MPRILIILFLVGIVYYFIKKLIPNSPFISCQKCDGKGFWIAMRGEKEKCDICKGAGKIPR